MRPLSSSNSASSCLHRWSRARRCACWPPAPPRFLPRFDNALLSHDGRARIVGEEHYRRIVAGGGMGSMSTFLVDGFVGGTWKAERSRGKTILVVQPLGTLSPEERDALAEEGEDFATFLAGTHDAPAEVRIGRA